ncbi:MAG: LamG domain-containing protein [Phycisphaerales bacterium]|nr:LamG domain-containing protein [Planctomycetota bacterium]
MTEFTKKAVPGLAACLAFVFSALAQPADMAHWWKADGNANDSAGTSHGTVAGSVIYAPGRYGQAFNFEGGEVQCGNTAGNFGTGDFTVAFWILNPSQIAALEVMSKRSTCNYGSQFDIRGGSGENGANMYFEAYTNSSASNRMLVFASELLNDRWHHIVYRRKGTSATAARDGIVISSVTTSGVTNINNTAQLRFAGGPCVGFDGTIRFTGLLDDIRFYDRYLTDAELRTFACATDMNGDLLVDDSDFSMFIVQYDVLACSDPAMPLGCIADFNQDGQVDDTDFVIFVGEYDQLICP